jgi:TBC1 domain family member 15
MDLESTLVRAESLFRRFERTVEAIDKKHNFPPPKIRQRPVLVQDDSPRPTQSLIGAPSSPTAATVGNSTMTDVAVSRTSWNTPGKGKGRSSEENGQLLKRVVSPELRGLLSRKVYILPRKVVQKKGEGLRSAK